MELVLSHFCVYHINAPGQEPGADLMSEEEVFPDMEELSQSVEYICHHFGISSCVGIGCGLGANVLIRLAKRRSKFLEGLVLFNTDNQSAGWLEWTRNLVNIKSLAHSESLSESVVDYLLTYHFGSGGWRWSDLVIFVTFHYFQQARDGPGWWSPTESISGVFPPGTSARC